MKLLILFVSLVFNSSHSYAWESPKKHTESIGGSEERTRTKEFLTPQELQETFQHLKESKRFWSPDPGLLNMHSSYVTAYYLDQETNPKIRSQRVHMDCGKSVGAGIVSEDTGQAFLFNQHWFNTEQVRDEKTGKIESYVLDPQFMKAPVKLTDYMKRIELSSNGSSSGTPLCTQKNLEPEWDSAVLADIEDALRKQNKRKAPPVIENLGTTDPQVQIRKEIKLLKSDLGLSNPENGSPTEESFKAIQSLE